MAGDDGEDSAVVVLLIVGRVVTARALGDGEAEARAGEVTGS